MVPAGAGRAAIGDLVISMLDYVQASGLDLATLAANPSGAIAATGKVVVVPVDPAQLSNNCSIAAMYDPSSTPPRLLVSQDTSSGRRAFSTLHEFGHHLCSTVPTVLDAFWTMPDGGNSIEETLVDAFAAQVLIPDAARSAAFASGVTAEAVAELYRSVPASREATCVAAALELRTPGYVMLIGPEGRAQFTARSGDIYAIRRDTPQDATRLEMLMRVGHSRGVDRPRFASGTHGQEMHFDAVRVGGYSFVVWVTDTPAWEAMPVRLDAGPKGIEGYCDSCDWEFTSWRQGCTSCGEPYCPHCGRCSCEPRGHISAAAKEKVCDACFQLLPLAMFPGDASTCNLH
jgi:hypothetical protein